MKRPELKNVRHGVFWPSYLAFFLIGTLSYIGGAPFVVFLQNLRDALLSKLDWLFAYGTFSMVLVCLAIYVSPLAHIKIGGIDAKPLLSKPQWFAIALCTTVAAGIMFWATCEPLIHLNNPPWSKGITKNSLDAENFALATLFHHWSITPSAIYTVPALTFALTFYNLKQPFSLASMFVPILGHRAQKYARLIDGFCVFSLVTGMAASLGTGALTISGAYENYFSQGVKPWLLGALITTLVLCFTASATSGLMKGIRMLSLLNVKMFVAMVIIMCLCGPLKDMVLLSWRGLVYFGQNFITMSTFIPATTNDNWPLSWPIFYWASWLSWAPITAVFLGKIAYGHKVRDFIHINLFAPAMFSCVWTAVFGSASLAYNRIDGSLYKTLNTLGPNAVSYDLIQRFPMPLAVTIFFVVITFISYTTAADSTTDAISSLCTKQPLGSSLSLGSNTLKIVWAVTIGFVAWVLVSHAGVEGMKLLSCLGGLPALFLLIMAMLSLIKMGFVDLKVTSPSPAKNNDNLGTIINNQEGSRLTKQNAH